MLFELAGEAGKLFASLREIVGAGGEAAGELGDAVGVGGGAGGDAFEFDGGLIGLGSGLANLLVERVAVADAFGVLGVHGLDSGGLRVDLGREQRDLFGGGGLLERRAATCGWRARRGGGCAALRGARCNARPWRPGA